MSIIELFYKIVVKVVGIIVAVALIFVLLRSIFI